MKSGAVLLAVGAVALVSALGWRGRLETLSRPVRSPRAADGARGAHGAAALFTPAAGFLRPLAINFLWLRARALEEERRFLEMAVLSRAITELQPRLPEVWAHQAWNMAYNITRESPPDARLRWVFEAVRLLRDHGLRHNPESLRLHADLSMLFFLKIGGETDSAHILYKGALANAFEVDPTLAADDRRELEAKLLDEWGLDAALLEELGREYLEPAAGDAARLDLRAAAAHALYWAEAGLRKPAGASERWHRYLLGRHAIRSVLELLDQGYVVREAVGDDHAFFPDLRFAPAAARAFEEAAERDDLDALERQEIQEARLELAGRMVLYLVSWNRPDDAEEWLVRYRDLAGVQGPDPSLSEFVAKGIVPDLEQRERSIVLQAIAALLGGSLGLRLAGEEALATGLERLAEAVVGEWNRRGPPEPLAETTVYLAALARDWRARLGAEEPTRHLALRLESFLRERGFGAEGSRARDLGLPRAPEGPPASPFPGVLALDPLVEPEEEVR